MAQSKRDQFRLKMGQMGICSKEDLIQDLYDVLWPEGAEDEPWSPDTIEALDQIFVRYNLHPQKQE